MTNKKAVKQLMALGVQRNDAAAFARTYRKIMDARREDLFPDIIKPAMPVMGQIVQRELRPLRAAYLAPERQAAFFRENDEEFAKRIAGKLSESIAEGLVKSGAMVMRIEKIQGIGTQFTATVYVAMPDGR